MVSTAHCLIRNAWLKISASATQGDVCLCDETIVRAISSRYPCIINTINLNHKNDNSALGGPDGAFDSSSIIGFYHTTFRTKCPYADKYCKKAPHDVHYYYHHLMKNPTQTSRPSDVQDIIVTTFWAIKCKERTSAAESKRNKNDVIGTAIQELTAKNKKE